MKRGLVISLVVFLTLSLGGCGIGSLGKESTKDNGSDSASGESKRDSTKLSDILSKVISSDEENEVVKEDIVSNENDIVGSGNKVEVKETEENLTDKAHIQKAEEEILKYATYLEENLIYWDFVNINDHISGKDEEVNALRGVKMYHFVQNREWSPQEFYYNPNTGDVFVAIQSLIFRLNDYKHINPNECGAEYIYTLSKVSGIVTLEPNKGSNQIISKEESQYTEYVDPEYIVKMQYEEADAELNKIWKELKNKGKIADSLLNSELEWIKYKDNLSSYNQKLRATKERIYYLNNFR